ncbi:hypothetical protein C8A01DRAFT_38700 [Parachaetomium inaequale]|uniref:FAD dependent oxidoreductase domain-containing protein n=1 Tax=Parachaetomium inaequale TaxID=2588326 RepID=A0AAN6PAP3_9PEZI|nr:hypothetical protein C8A01DRAFT_38700 [Parachaetomium inaequale]
MGKITIFGAGITGLSTAFILSQNNPSHAITIVARDLPGDDPSQNWASPWACAGWVALGGTPLEQEMQLTALTFLRRLALDHPESSVRCVELTDIFPDGVKANDTSPGGVWFSGRVPDFEVIHDGSDGEGAKVKYGSAVLTPGVFLPWLKARLEERGVKFVRVAEVKALGELTCLGHDVLVNASGLASLTLLDVWDESVVMDRTYVCVVKSEYPFAHVKRGAGIYTYAFGRGDGTAALGGVSDSPVEEVKPTWTVRTDIMSRMHATLPSHFPSSEASYYKYVEDLVGIRPMRLAGVRTEKQDINGQKVVHAYGTTIGGYIHSFGLAQVVARLVEESLSMV